MFTYKLEKITAKLKNSIYLKEYILTSVVTYLKEYFLTYNFKSYFVISFLDYKFSL